MIDTSLCVADVLYRLGFKDAADIALTGTWVTVTELYQWADEAAKLLAYRSGLFVTVDATITVVSGTATYALPASHVFTMAAWLATNMLRITSVKDLRALDATWTATSGPATRASFDAAEVGKVVIYPNPTAGGTLTQLAEEMAADIAIGTPTVPLPTVLQDYFSLKMLAGARGKESEGAQLEMAEHYDMRCKMYETLIEHLYGEG